MSSETDPKARELLKRHDSMVQCRSKQDGIYQELKELVRPDTTDFYGAAIDLRSNRRKIFDGTAPWSAEQLASGLHSYNSNPTDRWFGLTVAGVPYPDLDFETRMWLEQVSELLYAQFSDPVASLNPALHECYSDLPVFGTGIVYEWYDIGKRQLMFRSFPLADCWIDERADGTVNRVHRRIKWTIEQIEAEFGSLPPKLAKLKDEKKHEMEVEVIHAVYENEGYDGRGSGKRYKSCYVCKDTEEILEEGGYDWMPYHTPRWAKLAGEKYGRGPGMAVLPEVRMVNAMSKTMLAAAQKIVDPPLQVPDDGFMLPLRQTPGGLNFKRPGTENIEPLPTAQRIDIGVEMIEQRRSMIRQGFYIDWLVRPTKKERQTAQEINDDRNQMLSMMAPIVGRLQAELLGPLVRLSYFLLDRHGDLPAPPESLRGRRMDVAYLSPAARAQTSVRGQGINLFLDRCIQLQPVMPEAMDAVVPSAIIEELADYMDVPRRVLASPQVVAQKAQARAEQAQAQQMIEAAPAVGKAASDLANAQKNGLQLF